MKRKLNLSANMKQVTNLVDISLKQCVLSNIPKSACHTQSVQIMQSYISICVLGVGVGGWGAKANGREPKSCLGQVFNFKSINYNSHFYTENQGQNLYNR